MALEPIPESTVYYTRLSLGPYKRVEKFALSPFEEKLVVHLPLPTELRDDTAVSYTNVNLETVGDLIQDRSNAIDAAALRSVGALAQMAAGATSSGIASLLDNRFTGSGLVSGAAGGFISAIQSLIPADQLSSVLQQKYGAAPNPNPSVMFQGPVLRDFSFSWAFYPKNAKESRTIQDLIKKLKGRALPSDNAEGSSAILNYPHICQLNFFPWDTNGKEDNGWSDNSIIKIKKCFMQSVNVNYNAFGTPGFFEDTQLPISYQLSIQFKEIDYLLSKDWDSDAATERANTALIVSTARILGDGFRFAGQATGALAVGLGQTAKDFITGDIPNQNDQDNIDAVNKATGTLKAGDTNSKVIARVAARGFRDSFFDGTYNPLDGGRGPGEVTLTLDAANKYVVVFNEDDVPANAKVGGFIVTPPETLGTFNTKAELDAFLLEQDLSKDSTITTPPPPAAAAPAP